MSARRSDGEGSRRRGGNPDKRGRPKKSAFLRGVATLLPVFLTIWVFLTIVNFVSSYVVGPINDAIYWSLEGNGLGWKVLDRMGVDPLDRAFLDIDQLPVDVDAVGLSEGYDSNRFAETVREYREEHISFLRDLPGLFIEPERLRDAVDDRVHPLIGLGVSLLLVSWIGWLVGGFMGRRLVGRVEHAIGSLPGVRSVYPYAKQFVEFFVSDSEMEFETVVAIPYPSQGFWSVAFVTSRSMRTLREATGEDLVTVFVPSSPMPMTGYTIHVPVSRIIPLPISVDDALRVTVSGGVLIPEKEYAGDVPERLRAVVDEDVPSHGDSGAGTGAGTDDEGGAGPQ